MKVFVVAIVLAVALFIFNCGTEEQPKPEPKSEPKPEPKVEVKKVEVQKTESIDSTKLKVGPNGDEGKVGPKSEPKLKPENKKQVNPVKP